MLANLNLIYSPFEQFDAVTWIIVDYLFESKYYLDEYMFYSVAPEVNCLISPQKSVNIKFLLSVFYFIIILINILNLDIIKTFLEPINPYIDAIKQEKLSFVFFFIFFFMFTSGLFTFWFSDVLILESPEYGFYDYPAFDLLAEYIMEEIQIIPQINFSILLDENLISFFAAFFLFNGAEESEDENFILEEEESDFIGDVVAPLFISNLGKDVEDNGALFLKISGIFGFILLNNLMGMLPYSDTGTSSLLLTFWVSLSVFVSLLTLMISKHGIHYLFNLFLPHGIPFPLIFLLIPIEFVSYTFRLLSLSVRLFANMMAGHTLLKVIVGFSWTMILMGDFFLVANIFPIGILFVLIFLEIGVALIQAYVFTILTCMYLKDIFVGH